MRDEGLCFDVFVDEFGEFGGRDLIHDIVEVLDDGWLIGGVVSDFDSESCEANHVRN